MTADRGSFGEPDVVRHYLDEIGRHDLLTKQDEIDLAQRIEEGERARGAFDSATTPAEKRQLRRAISEGDAAFERFVTANLRLVVSIAKRYSASGMPLADLIQEGNLGLIRAVEKFDWRKGFKFSTYATWWIRQAIQRGIGRSARLVHLPNDLLDRIGRLEATAEDLESELGRKPTMSELADALDLTEERLSGLLQFRSDPMSLDAPLDEDSDSVFSDVVAADAEAQPHNLVLDDLQPTEVRALMDCLDERERHILVLRYGLEGEPPLARSVIAERTGVEPRKVRVLEQAALEKLRARPDLDEARLLLAS
ncbi:MAG: sigma-70 family RNA polymerase sigma factor [Actinomycetota bacterium]|nr:sigma-70 family RNA polymerase sigma factor [Actinomycetota bacterium]